MSVNVAAHDAEFSAVDANKQAWYRVPVGPNY